MNMPEIYLFDGSSLKAMNRSDIMKFLAGGDDKVFLISGMDDEIYIIEDPVTIKKMEKITKTHPEVVALKMMLQEVNPKRYGRK